MGGQRGQQHTRGKREVEGRRRREEVLVKRCGRPTPIRACGQAGVSTHSPGAPIRPGRHYVPNTNTTTCAPTVPRPRHAHNGKLIISRRVFKSNTAMCSREHAKGGEDGEMRGRVNMKKKRKKEVEEEKKRCHRQACATFPIDRH